MNTAPAEPPLLYTVEETAHLLSISEWKVRDLIRSGTLHAIPIGSRHIRITRASIEKFARVRH